MNRFLLNTESQEFINDNLDSDINTLALRGNSFNGVSTKELVEQIEAKKKCQKKLPTWFNQKGIYYPNKLNIEQTSSEITANYKARLIDGQTIIDLTGGFGVDCYYFTQHFNKVIHCEINEDLSKIVNYNFRQLKIDTIETITSDGIEFLKNCNEHFDWIYVDPSRRDVSKTKVFFLKDCLPNVPKDLKLLFEHSTNIMVKTSPLLDISIGISELNHVKTVHIVAVNNDVKELLWVLENGYASTIMIKTINIKPETNEVFIFERFNESQEEAYYNVPLTYLYEPNASILKAGAFNSIATQLKVHKLHKHSHLYTSETFIEFPGRCFKIDLSLQYNKKSFKKLGITKANITTRNFPETVQQIRKTFNIKDGGTSYIFFTTNMFDEKIVLVCTKVVPVL